MKTLRKDSSFNEIRELREVKDKTFIEEPANDKQVANENNDEEKFFKLQLQNETNTIEDNEITVADDTILKQSEAIAA